MLTNRIFNVAVTVLFAGLAAVGAPARESGGDRNGGGGNNTGGGFGGGGTDRRGGGGGMDRRAGGSGFDRNFGGGSSGKTTFKDDPNAKYKIAEYQELFSRNLFSRYPKRQVREVDPEEQARMDEMRAQREAEFTRARAIPNHDKDHVLVGIVVRDGLSEAFVEDRHSNKLVIVKPGEKLGTGKVGEITIDSLEYIANNKSTKVAYGRNLEGGFSEAVPYTPPVWRKGDVQGEEGLSPEERMKRKRMREMGIPVPELKPATQTTDNNQQPQEEMSNEERWRRMAERFNPGFNAEGFQPPEGFNFGQFPNGGQFPNNNNNQGDQQNNQNTPNTQGNQNQGFQPREFNRDNRGGEFNRDNRGGEFNRDNRGGEFNRDRRQDYQNRDTRQDTQSRERREYPSRDQQQNNQSRDTRQDFQNRDTRQDAQPAQAPATNEDTSSIAERMKRKREAELNGGGGAPAADAPRTPRLNPDDPNLTPEERLKAKRQKENQEF